MTLISEDVVACQGLTVVTRSRKSSRKAVNGQKLDNSGTVTFGIEFQGKATEVIALVSSSIEGEVLLSWQVLQKLGVIKSDFPNIEVRAAVVSTAPGVDAIRNEQEARAEVVQMIEEFGPVFNEEGPLRTMKEDPMKIHIKPSPEYLHSEENTHCVPGSSEGQDRFRLGNGHHREGGWGIAVVLPDVFCPQT